jgi:uncharacterized membrane protein YbhN (UPF0104 family)
VAKTDRRERQDLARLLYNATMKKHLRTVVALAIIAATVAAFGWYIKGHPQTIEQLRQLQPGLVAALIGLFGLAFLAYALVTRISLGMFGKMLSRQENMLFNAYSSLVNFFGPGQSGPAFRAVYLKKRHNLGIKQYAFTTLLYFGFFAVISVLFIFAGTRPWWQTGLVVAAAAGMSLLIIRRYQRRAEVGKTVRLTVRNVSLLGLATAAQLLLQIAIYGIELHSVANGLSWGQILTYTGVANLSLFVALTPGGIGIRESLLLFSQDLHHIDSSTIVAASVIDRGVYVVFLGILFALVLSLHAKQKLHITDKKEES